MEAVVVVAEVVVEVVVEEEVVEAAGGVVVAGAGGVAEGEAGEAAAAGAAEAGEAWWGVAAAEVAEVAEVEEEVVDRRYRAVRPAHLLREHWPSPESGYPAPSRSPRYRCPCRSVRGPTRSHLHSCRREESAFPRRDSREP